MQISDLTSINYSGDVTVDSLLNDPAIWNFLLPYRNTLYYTFDTSVGSEANQISPSVTPFNATQQNAARSVLAYAGALIGVTFVEVVNSVSADFHFAAMDLPERDVVGQTFSSWSYTNSGSKLSSVSAEAVVLLDNDGQLLQNNFPSAGNAGYQVLLHEVGHALGLGHPFDYPYQLPDYLDNTDNTVMSYTWTGAYKSTFQAFDLDALTWIYGADGLAGNWGYNSTFGNSLLPSTPMPTDTVAPFVLFASPVDGAADVAVAANLRLQFSEAIARGVGSIVLEAIDGSWTESFDASSGLNLTFDGAILIINPEFDLAFDTGYHLRLDAGAVVDLAGNSLAAPSNFDFFTQAPPDVTAPILLAASPSDGATGVPIASNIEFRFSEAVQRGTGTVVLKTADGMVLENFNVASSSRVSIAGDVLMLDPVANLDYAKTYQVQFGAGVVKDMTGNALAGPGNFVFSTVALNKIFNGTTANDRLAGGAGNDTLLGMAGTDTAVFRGDVRGYQITYNRAQGSATVADTVALRDGTDHLTSIEKLQFGGQTFDLLNPARTEAPGYLKSSSFLFDAAYYLLSNPDLVPTVTLDSAFESYQANAAQGAAPNAWFDPVYYANRWADLQSLNLDAATLFAHYNLFGVWEGRSAGPIFDHFDGDAYLSANPDVAAYVDAKLQDFLGSRSNGAIAHYVIFGANEGRIAHDLSGAVISADFTIEATLVGVVGG